jgi:phosphoribosyl 1,2-cyclic phosphodiesterase
VRARIWGCRGSIASPGAETDRYGGNTSCVEIRLSDGELIVLDAGTGILRLGSELAADGPARVHLLLTHLHVDHLEGLGMFAPLWSPETELHIWGPSSPLTSLADRIATYFSPPLFPVHLSEVPARVMFHDASETEWRIGDALLVSHAILHPCPTVGYRIEEGGRVLTYLTDHEPALGADLAAEPLEWISGSALAHHADLLIHDCQYTPEEYEGKPGWGHSTTEHVATFAARTGAGALLLFHHDPMHDDEQLERMRDDVIRRWGVEPERCALAAEGAAFDV